MTGLLRSVAFRIALVFALTVTLTTTLVFGVVYWRLYRSNVALVEHVLENEAAKALLLPPPQLRTELELRLTQDLRRLDYVGLYNRRSERLFGNVSEHLTIPADGKPHLLRDVPSPMPGVLRNENAIFIAQMRSDGEKLVLGRSLVDVDDVETAMLRGFAATIAPVILFAIAIAWVVSRRALRRLAEIQDAISRVMSGELETRLPGKGTSDDIDALVGAVNRMLDEIGRLVGQIASVGDNIAHDLRAPLAVLRARLERGLAGSSEEELRAVAWDALDDLDRAMTTVTALLRISALESGVRRGAFDAVDLSVIAREAFELFEPLAQDKDITMVLDAPGPAVVPGDGDLLREALANLIDNAIKYTSAGGQVRISCGIAGALLRVSDTGPGIDAGEREKILKRFYRGARTAHVPGAGLGLSMAATIIDLHGLDLRIRDNHPGAIFEISSRELASQTGVSSEHPRV